MHVSALLVRVAGSSELSRVTAIVDLPIADLLLKATAFCFSNCFLYLCSM